MSVAYNQSSQQTESWLDCKIDDGMFSDEIAVTYPKNGAVQKSVFVNRHAVRGNPGEQGQVRVTIIRRSGSTMAVLPSSERDIV